MSAQNQPLDHPTYCDGGQVSLGDAVVIEYFNSLGCLAGRFGTYQGRSVDRKGREAFYLRNAETGRLTRYLRKTHHGWQRMGKA